MNLQETAIVYVPPDIDDDGVFACQGIVQIHESGYRLGGVLRDWLQLLRIAREGKASVAVFAREEHCTHVWSSIGLRCEFVGEDIRQLPLRVVLHPARRQANRPPAAAEQCVDLADRARVLRMRRRWPNEVVRPGNAARLVDEAARKLGFD